MSTRSFHLAQRVDAALPQIQSLNPLVKIDPRSTLLPFSDEDKGAEIDEFLIKENVDLVCATDLTKDEMVSALVRSQSTPRIY